MKVLHIGHVPLPEAIDLGPGTSKLAKYPGRWVLNLAKAQKAHSRIKPEILVKVPGSRIPKTVVMEEIPVHFFPVPNLARGKTFFALDRFLLAKEIKRLQPELVHAHGTEESNGLAALDSKLPCVLTIQGCYFIINRKLPARFFSRQWIVERLERRSIPKFGNVITKSEYIRKEIEAEFPGVKTHLIPNTYNPDLEEIPFDQPRENSIALIGSIDPRKGVDLIVEAVRINAEKLKAEMGRSEVGGRSDAMGEEMGEEMVKAEMGDEGRGQRSEKEADLSTLCSGPSTPILHIFGNHGEGVSDYEKKQISDLRSILGERLILHGLVDQVEMAKIIATCRALVAPSREEMFGNQVIEALLVGTHVIVADETAMAENVRRFGNGTIVPQENAPALAEAIATALDSPLSNLDLRVTARERISNYMGPIIVANSHLELYKSIL